MSHPSDYRWRQAMSVGGNIVLKSSNVSEDRKRRKPPWSRCEICCSLQPATAAESKNQPSENGNEKLTFRNATEFASHLRQFHSTREGGSFICKFGRNGICASLPLEGVSDKDYELHIAKEHIFKKRNSIDKPIQPDKQQQASTDAVLPRRNSKKRSNLFPSPSPTYETTFATGSNIVDFNGSTNQPNLIHDLNPSQRWSIYSCSQNLTSLLNDPQIPRNVVESIFSRDWGTYFTDNNHITDSPFLFKISSFTFEDYIKLTEKRNRLKGHLNSLKPLCIDNRNRPQNAQEISELVPKIFLKSDFDLANGEIFHQVVPSQSEKVSSSVIGAINKAELRQIANRLSDHLDLIEEHLSSQIAMKFRDFFHIMNAMDSVMEQLNRTIKEVTSVRYRCTFLQRTLIMPSLRSIQLTKRRHNEKKLYAKLLLMSTVYQTQPTIQLLLNNCDYLGALDLISTTEEVVSSELGGINCFRHLKSQLKEIRKVIDRMMQDELLKLLNCEWNRPPNEDEKDSLNLENEVISETELNDPEKLAAILLGMLRVNCQYFITTFRDEAQTAIRACIKQIVIEYLASEDCHEIKSRFEVGLFEELRQLEFSNWLRVLMRIFDAFIILLKRVTAAYRVMNRVIDSRKSSEENQFNEDPSEDHICKSTHTEYSPNICNKFNQLKTSLKETLNEITDYSHTRCAALIDVRTKDDSFIKQLSVEEFLQFTTATIQFISQTHSITGRTSPGLRLLLQTQSNHFATRFHTDRKSKLSSILEIEQWKSLDTVPVDFKAKIDHIFTSSAPFSSRSSEESTNSSDSTTKQLQFSVKTQSYLIIDNQSYSVTNSVIALIEMVSDYCQLASQVPILLGADLLTRLLDLLKHFNVRVSRLVLGAEALQFSGLTTITTRHLLISCRNLQLIIILLPILERHFEQILTEKQRFMVKHFSELATQYQEHIQQIYEKVIAIVRGIMESKLSKWEAKPPIPSSQFGSITKDLIRLHECVKDVMSEDDLNRLFKRVHSAFLDLLRINLTRLKIANDNGPQHSHVMLDMAFYMQSLKKISAKMEFSSEDLWSK